MFCCKKREYEKMFGVGSYTPKIEKMMKKFESAEAEYKKKYGCDVLYIREALSYVRSTCYTIKGKLFGTSNIWGKKINALWWLVYIVPIIGQIALIWRVRHLLDVYIKKAVAIDHKRREEKTRFFEKKGIRYE